MAYSDKNKLRIFAENAGNEIVDDVTGVTYSDDDWKVFEERKRGARAGIAPSKDYNTALKQTSLMATTLAEIFARRYNKEVTTNIENITSSTYSTYEDYVTALAEMFSKTNMLLEGEVEVKHLSENLKKSTFNDMTVGNVNSKINGKDITTIFETNGTTVKNATNSEKIKIVKSENYAIMTTTDGDTIKFEW